MEFAAFEFSSLCPTNTSDRATQGSDGRSRTRRALTRDVDTQGNNDQSNCRERCCSAAPMGSVLQPQVENFNRVPDDLAVGGL